MIARRIFYKARDHVAPDSRFVLEDNGSRLPGGEWFARSATFSPCRRYRYLLERGVFPLLPFVMLNPSTADAVDDDPTIRRCLGFAKREGFGGISVLNLYGYRSKSPAECMAAPDRVGEWTDSYLRTKTLFAPMIVCAWGAHAEPSRVAHVLSILRDRESRRHAARLVCLGFNANGSPRHPLYLNGDTPLEPFPRGSR